MSRSENAQLAVALYETLRVREGLNKATAWRGIAELLLSCDVWLGSSWRKFHDVVVYREANDFKKGKQGPNAVLRRADDLSAFLASELGVSRAELCARIGQYWRHKKVRRMQPHNLVGHAFRSLIVTALQNYGCPDISYQEEVSPTEEFPGHQFTTRSEDAKIDIVARRGNRTVALMSCRWRFRHDRVDVVDEAMAYVPAARRQNKNCQFYAVIGEFAPNRLDKILSNSPPENPNGAVSAAVHFCPDLILKGLKENGRMNHLKSLEWLIDQTFSW